MKNLRLLFLGIFFVICCPKHTYSLPGNLPEAITNAVFSKTPGQIPDQIFEDKNYFVEAISLAMSSNASSQFINNAFLDSKRSAYTIDTQNQVGDTPLYHLLQQKNR